MVSALIIMFCTCLLVYWASRTLMLLHGSYDEIDEILAGDQQRVRRLLLGLRSLFTLSSQLAG